MKIRIHTVGFHMTLPIPNALAFNHAVSLIASKAIRESGSPVQITPKQFDCLWRALRRQRQYWGRLTLVEVYSANGDEVRITL